MGVDGKEEDQETYGSPAVRGLALAESAAVY
jgi:hypothetical protein